MATKKKSKGPKKKKPDPRTASAEKFSKMFLAEATKNGWEAAVCYILTGEKRADGGERVMGGCGGERESLKTLTIYISGKVASKLQEVEKN